MRFLSRWPLLTTICGVSGSTSAWRRSSAVAERSCLGLPICEIVPPLRRNWKLDFLRVLAGDIVEDSVLRGWSEHSAVGRGEIHSFAALRNESGAVAGVLWIAREDRPTVSAPVCPGLERWRILMAEDLAMNQEIIAEMLESAGYEVLIVADGASAIEPGSSGVIRSHADGY